MFRKILVPVDLSHDERCDALIEQAKRLAGLDGGELMLLNVVADIPTYVAAELPPELHQKAMASADAELRRLAEKHALPATTRLLVEHGSPAPRILDAAKDNEVDVIVIASHQPGLADYLIGSVAGKVVRHAHCTVVVLR